MKNLVEFVNLFRRKSLFMILATLALTMLNANEKIHVSKEKICKAAISSIMGVDHQTIKSNIKEDGSVYLYYKIKGKWVKYDYKCKLDGKKVIWGTAMARWRTQSDDAVITYSVENDHLIIKEKFRDEPESEAIITTFPLAQL